MMGLAAAAFHWTPSDYMRATPHEMFAAYEAFQAMNSTGED